MSQLYPESVQRLIAEFSRLPGIGARSAERLAFHILSSTRDEAMGLALAIRDVKQSIRACMRCFNTAEGALCPICQNPRRDVQLLCVVELPRDIVALEKCGGYSGLYHVLQGRLDPLGGIGPERLRIAELFHRLRHGFNAELPEQKGFPPEAIAAPADAPAEPLHEVDPSAAETAMTGIRASAQESACHMAAGSSDATGLQPPAHSGDAESTQVREVILALNPTTEGDATANYLADELAAAFPQLRITRLARGLASGTDLESSAPSSLQYALNGRQPVGG